MWEPPVPNDNCNCPGICDRNPRWQLETIQNVSCSVASGVGFTKLTSPSEVAAFVGPSARGCSHR